MRTINVSNEWNDIAVEAKAHAKEAKDAIVEKRWHDAISSAIDCSVSWILAAETTEEGDDELYDACIRASQSAKSAAISVVSKHGAALSTSCIRGAGSHIEAEYDDLAYWLIRRHEDAPDSTRARLMWRLSRDKATDQFLWTLRAADPACLYLQEKIGVNRSEMFEKDGSQTEEVKRAILRAEEIVVDTLGIHIDVMISQRGTDAIKS